jgi:hypothetical protein
MKTYLTIYQGEQRVIELEIRDQDDVEYTPTKAYATVVNDAGVIVMDETECVITTNKATILIESTDTDIPGDYEIIWRITKTINETTYTYYHKTQLVIEEL